MTREERAKAEIQKLCAPTPSGLQSFTFDDLFAAMLTFADDEAAAMRERAAEVALAHVASGFASSRENATATAIAAAIRALSTRGEG